MGCATNQNSGGACPTFTGPRNTAPSTKRSGKARAHNLDMAARGLEFPEAFTGNEALDFAQD
jgi:hypothetical protein